VAAGKIARGQPGKLPRNLKIVLATGNRGKLREIQSLLGGAWTLVPQSELGIDPADENGVTFAENAVIKARHASAHAGLPAIADDSGLEVDALHGAPGIRSARYAGESGRAADVANNVRLLAELESVPAADRTARFRCVVAFVRDAADPAPIVAEGVWEGRIAAHCSGENGFGYDPLFIDAESGLTGGQLAPEQKNLSSHRGLAVRRLREALEALIGPD
jgi:XTP/dITP diphosphohydrolase